MRYLVSRKRFIKEMSDKSDSNMYQNILDEFKNFIYKTDTVCCYNIDVDYHEGLKVVKQIREHSSERAFNEYAKKIYTYVKFYEPYENVPDIAITTSILIKPSKINYFDIFGEFSKILKCEIMYEITGIYIRYIIESGKSGAPSLLKKYSITNRMS